MVALCRQPLEQAIEVLDERAVCGVTVAMTAGVGGRGLSAVLWARASCPDMSQQLQGAKLPTSKLPTSIKP
jgi:hypothetical protein